MNDEDCQHGVEWIEDVQLAELNTVRSYSRLMLVHLLKHQGWPDRLAADHWRHKIVSFQSDAAQRLSVQLPG